MRKSELIEILNSIKGDPHVGLDVFTNHGSEFWAMSKHLIHTNDNGQSLALTTCRLRSALPASRQIKVKIPGVDSLDCNVKTVLQKFTDKYDITNIDVNTDFKNESLQEFLCSTVYADPSELIRLLEDMLRLFNKKELNQKYGVVVTK